MDFQQLFADKTLKSKEKTDLISELLADHLQLLDALLQFAGLSKDPVKASCIEAIEHATKVNPGISSPQCLQFAVASLGSKSPRVKWESARLIGNIAHLFPDQLEEAIGMLLTNASHTGTVVRWSAAYALGNILAMRTPHNEVLVPAIEAICQQELKNSIRKIYLLALKKL